MRTGSHGTYSRGSSQGMSPPSLLPPVRLQETMPGCSFTPGITTGFPHCPPAARAARASLCFLARCTASQLRWDLHSPCSFGGSKKMRTGTSPHTLQGAACDDAIWKVLIHGNQGAKSKDENFASAPQLVPLTLQIMELLCCAFWAAGEQLGSSAGGDMRLLGVCSLDLSRRIPVVSCKCATARWQL